MGRDIATLQVTALLSRHNSPQDREHDELWDRLVARIAQVVDDPEFAPISAMLS